MFSFLRRATNLTISAKAFDELARVLRETGNGEPRSDGSIDMTDIVLHRGEEKQEIPDAVARHMARRLSG